ncbi:MAG: hypothetical protein ACI9NY_000810 [Kiritimatiellia bacterium]|jgi:uncharacterized protein YceH (UPF0502 family)
MLELSLYEIRVLGALMEKAVTTPDQYPLSLNALSNACNQKSNREPVMALEEAQVQDVVDGLKHKKLVGEARFGGRTAKFKHRFCNTEFSEIHLNPQEFSIICVLFLRGPQTPGELRTRTNRLYSFTDVQAVDASLEDLLTRKDGPFVIKLERESGKRDARYAHLFSGPVDTDTTPSGSADTDERQVLDASDQENRIVALEREVASLREELLALKLVFDL